MRGSSCASLFHSAVTSTFAYFYRLRVTIKSFNSVFVISGSNLSTCVVIEIKELFIHFNSLMGAQRGFLRCAHLQLSSVTSLKFFPALLLSLVGEHMVEHCRSSLLSCASTTGSAHSPMPMEQSSFRIRAWKAGTIYFAIVDHICTFYRS